MFIKVRHYQKKFPKYYLTDKGKAVVNTIGLVLTVTILLTCYIIVTN